jgi:hypothetical protein
MVFKVSICEDTEMLSFSSLEMSIASSGYHGPPYQYCDPNLVGFERTYKPHYWSERSDVNDHRNCFCCVVLLLLVVLVVVVVRREFVTRRVALAICSARSKSCDRRHTLRCTPEPKPPRKAAICSDPGHGLRSMFLRRRRQTLVSQMPTVCICAWQCLLTLLVTNP